ncbi:protein Shroom4 isoform X2 [Salarias fasciatus]|uniref:ASD2 domain-containing protein n=2 Tax=Salarias fasciatus TaxID=181472 RepID=A0A672ICC9_SALFA|nr:protein Shroom4 isoform X2 [Salarias fasciatus]
MQIHPGAFTLPWHSTDNSDLSMQWGQLSRPYSSTDQSSSLGSMESLDTPTPTAQPYSDSHSSPVDPALFNNKRDSAYSSFSASSNTSDYATVPLRPGEACSMDNLLQSLGPAYQGYHGGDTSTLGRSSGEVPDEAQQITHKSRSLTRPRQRPAEVKDRPSSCCYEQELRGGDFEIVRNGESDAGRKINPPQPPTRKDSFRATRSRPNVVNKRCASAPIENSRVPYFEDSKSPLVAESGIQNGFSILEEHAQTGNFKKDSSDSHFVQRQSKDRQIRCDTSDKEYKPETTSNHLSDSASQTSSGPSSLPADASTETQGKTQLRHSHTKHSSTGLHRHSAPEKLLATQLQLLQFDSDGTSSESYNQSNPSVSSQWSDSSVQTAKEDLSSTLSNKWGGSRCSTPGSVFLEEDVDAGNANERLEGSVNGGSVSPVHHHIPWGRSASVPGEPVGSSTQERVSCDQMLQSDFAPLSAAASMDTLLDEHKTVGGEGKKEEDVKENASPKKSNSSRNFRRNRRRSDRFATNLRNEIQRKKAQLQSSRGPGGLLCSGETVQEEGPDLIEEGVDIELPSKEKPSKVSFAAPAIPQDSQTTSNASSEANHEGSPSSAYPQNSSSSRSVQILDPGLPSFGVGIRVVEEPAPAGKARRWRWTPEHKLQPEPAQQCGFPGERVLGVTGSRHGVCAFTSSTSYGRSSSCSRIEETDILPFADRMKFFEATSKGVPVPNMSSLPGYRQKKTSRYPEHHGGDPVPPPTQRRYSYQGGLQQEGALLQNTLEARRQSVSIMRERQREKEREQAREMEERAREREREERLRERERQQERERQEKELEMERLREIQREERVRQWEMERERELELEREKEMERIREMERLKKEREKELEREREREEDPQLSSRHEFYSSSGFRERNQDFQHKESLHSFQPKPQAYSHCQLQNQVQRSAFHPVSSSSQQPHQQGYAERSYTPAETYPARQQETTKINRKYSLTERDYSSWRRESRPAESAGHQGRWGSRQQHFSSDDHNGYSSAPPPAPLALRGRAMSENDLRFDGSHRWSPSVSMSASQTLSEVEEGGGDAAGRQGRKKTPPPPRPPPPKWEQFHRRRASHHALFAAPAPPPNYSAHSASYVPPPEESRQRSYSLPPERQEASEGGCPRCSCVQTQDAPANQHPAPFQDRAFAVAPPSPMFSRRAFRPVAPPQRETDVREEAGPSLPPPPPPPLLPPPAESRENSSPQTSPEQNRPTVNPHQQQSVMRPAAQWERAPSPRIHSDTALPPAVENGGISPPLSSYLNEMGLGEQQRVPEAGTESEATLSPSPAHSLEADLDVPLETDIDDFQEEELPAGAPPLTSELPCFALPVTVLETDIDTLGDPGASPPGRGSPEEEEELEAGESLEELFPHGGEGDSGMESWRGAYQTTEHSTDSLDRRSGASSSCSSYYSTSAAKAQLLSQMKDFAEQRERSEDDELTYKRQLMESLRKKLGVLREAQRGLQEDIRANAQLGEEVENMVVSVCKPNEVDKFRMFIGDLDKVVSLLLSLSGRLLRVETTLDTLDPETEHHERLPLQEKKRQLMRQLSEAQDLKEHVDRREQAVSRVLGRCLSPEQHRDYSHFVKMKAALLVEQRQLEDKIRLGEEQLRGLRESLGLGLGLGLGMGMSMGYGHF